MYEYISFLRGINVGGKVLKMDRVVELYLSVGLADVRSYIQSGNVLFNTSKWRLKGLERELQHQIEYRLSFDVSVIIRSRQQLKSIIRNNPFSNRSDFETRSSYVTFLSGRIREDSLRNVGTEKITIDEYRLAETEVYLFCPGGYGKTIYSNNFFEKNLGTRATTRNWNTITKLLEISETNIETL
jgi:uncharacterized protein (DUF1697 family)